MHYTNVLIEILKKKLDMVIRDPKSYSTTFKRRGRRICYSEFLEIFLNVSMFLLHKHAYRDFEEKT